MKRLWNDESGAILSAELVLLMTLLVIALTVGLKAISAAVVAELGDVAAAIAQIDQSYSYEGITGCQSATDGASFNDATDECDLGAVQTASGVGGVIDVVNDDASGE